MAVCAELVVLFEVPEISTAFVALIPPVNPPVTTGTDQLYSVPAGTMPFVILVGVNAKEVPLQIVAVIGLIVAKGLTVTVILKTAPLQMPETGVII